VATDLEKTEQLATTKPEQECWKWTRCVYVFIYVNTYIYIHVYVLYISIRVFIFSIWNICYICMYTCIDICTYQQSPKKWRRRRGLRVKSQNIQNTGFEFDLFMFTYIFTCKDTNVHMCIYTCIYLYIYMYIYI